MRQERINAIEQNIIINGCVSLESLASEFNVSLQTIRRDINQLLERGQIEKVYGGVCAKKNLHTAPPLHVREVENYHAKVRIGELAASLVPDNSSIFLDSGSTTINMVPHLVNKKNVVIGTYSLPIINEAIKHDLVVHALGGEYNKSTSSFVGTITTKNITSMHFNYVFLSTTGISILNGLSNTTYAEAEIKEKVVTYNDNQKIMLMSDISKFERQALFGFCPINRLTAVITDQFPSSEFVEYFEKNGIQLFVTES